MSKLLIIFVKNPQLGNVKTRLAIDIGAPAALEVYQLLLDHTRDITTKLSADKAVFYSEYIDQKDDWKPDSFQKQLQVGADLGKRMQHAFKWGFSQGYQSICLIGSDCYELTTSTLEDGFIALEKGKTVLGPSFDGGYYLIGLNQEASGLFEGKQWSTDSVLKDTLSDLKKLRWPMVLLPQLHDVDREKDLKSIPAWDTKQKLL